MSDNGNAIHISFSGSRLNIFEKKSEKKLPAGDIAINDNVNAAR